MKNKKIYLVTSGEYSDYSVDGVFTTREKAKDYIDSLGKDNFSCYDIEEYVLDPLTLMQREGVMIYAVRFNVATGFVYDAWDIEENYVNLENLNNPRQLHADHGLGYQVMVKAKDKEHAIKIAGDIRRELKLKLGYEK